MVKLAAAVKPSRASSAAPTGSASTTVDRRMAILLAAEKLFSQRGYHGVTIREIAVEAGVPLALVGYHFGPKHELFHAIFAHWQHTAELRLAQLESATLGPPGPEQLRRVVQAFVQPVLAQRASAEGEYYAQLVGRELSRQTPETRRVIDEFFDPLAHRFIDALHAACPGHQRTTAVWAYQFALGALLHHICDHRMPKLSLGLIQFSDTASAALLIDFITAGIGAVLPRSPSPRRRAPSPSTSRRPP